MDLVTAQERGQRQTDDEILLASARSEGRLLLTNDADFLCIHASWMVASRHHAGIVFRHQDMPVGEAVRRLHQYSLRTSAEAAADAVKFL